eukprot:scaffold320780_cov18-Tisochrysis_lutea.AAC.1
MTVLPVQREGFLSDNDAMRRFTRRPNTIVDSIMSGQKDVVLGFLAAIAGGKGCGPHSSHNWHGCSSETMDGGHFKWNGLQFDAARAASRKTSVLSSLKGNYTHIQEACTHMPASSHCKSQTCRRTCPGPTGGHPHARRLPGSAVFHCRHFQEPAGPGAASRCSANSCNQVQVATFSMAARRTHQAFNAFECIQERAAHHACSYQRFCHAHVAKIACLTFPKAAPLHEDHKGIGLLCLGKKGIQVGTGRKACTAV